MARIILASTSPTRIALLSAAGVDFEAMPPGVDEREVETPLLAAGKSPAEIALALAVAKAQALAGKFPEACVIGADQTLDCDGRRWTKPATLTEACEQLMALAGRTHQLHSAVAGARRGAVIWRHLDSARLTMRRLSPAFIADYLEKVGDAALTSVGGYQLEGRGIQLFERIEGDHFTILGLPLLAVLKWLREEGAIAS